MALSPQAGLLSERDVNTVASAESMVVASASSAGPIWARVRERTLGVAAGA
jgi:hypothetical protein